MMPFFGEVFGNPSSIHHIGRQTRAILDDARDRVAKVWQCKPSEVIFTSGGTESDNLAIFGTARALADKGKHIITSTIEHHAVLHCFQYLEKKEGFTVTYVPVDKDGLINPGDVKAAIRPDTAFVSIMAANNEIGTIEPVAEIGAICRERGIVFHTDAAQWFGKEPFENIGQFNADLVSFCAHKLHGPKGIGALYIKSPLHPDPIIFGGGHENERRAGTENLAAVMGLTEVMERFVRTPVFPREQLFKFTTELANSVSKINGVHLRGSQSKRLSNTISFTVEGADSITLLAGLDIEGVCASSGSACSAGSLEPSHVITALGVEKDEANSLVRFSLGRESTIDEVREVIPILQQVIERSRR
jgi:cysteine desulfurase